MCVRRSEKEEEVRSVSVTVEQWRDLNALLTLAPPLKSYSAYAYTLNSILGNVLPEFAVILCSSERDLEVR